MRNQKYSFLQAIDSNRGPLLLIRNPANADFARILIVMCADPPLFGPEPPESLKEKLQRPKGPFQDPDLNLRPWYRSPTRVQPARSLVAGVVHPAGVDDVVQAFYVGVLVDNSGPSRGCIELGFLKRLVGGCSDGNLVRSEDEPIAGGLSHFFRISGGVVQGP
jgi:hypothetical protein